MEQNPIENSTNERVAILRKQLAGRLGELFDNQQDFNARVDDFASQLDLFQKGGLDLDKDEIVRSIRESVNIKDRSVFIAHLLKVLDSFIVLRVTQAKLFEKLERESILSLEKNIKLSEVLYATLEEDGREAHVHLLPATELIKAEGYGVFVDEVKKGMAKLAEMVESNSSIERIQAISWIGAITPKLLERLGFRIIGEISEEERAKYFIGEDRPVVKASMTREELFAKYAKKEQR